MLLISFSLAVTDSSNIPDNHSLKYYYDVVLVPTHTELLADFRKIQRLSDQLFQSPKSTILLAINEPNSLEAYEYLMQKGFTFENKTILGEQAAVYKFCLILAQQRRGTTAENVRSALDELQNLVSLQEFEAIMYSNSIFKALNPSSVFPKDFHVISLGTNCFSRGIFQRGYISTNRETGQSVFPLDYAYSFNFSLSLNLIEAEFENYTESILQSSDDVGFLREKYIFLQESAFFSVKHEQILSHDLKNLQQTKQKYENLIQNYKTALQDQKWKVFCHFNLFDNVEAGQIDRFIKIMENKEINNYLLVVLAYHQPEFKYDNERVLVIPSLDGIYQDLSWYSKQMITTDLFGPNMLSNYEIQINKIKWFIQKWIQWLSNCQIMIIHSYNFCLLLHKQL
uniref:Uncharacterized protein n=1 Tax=Trepomonas sp. PC1 TaxID=1076344 RepID=A0A146K416_9EUKA|eukprot:JAP90396.1 Hypothetical protein TPC1_30109 [Trepomonas sp. PC1]